MMQPRSFTRILFVGTLQPGSTCLGRLDGLRALGLKVDALDTTDWLPSGPRILRSLVQRTYVHPSVRRMNLRFLAALRNSGYDMVWVEKGEWLYPWTLSRARKRGCALVHYNTDDLYGAHSHFWLHRLGIKNYDLYLTTNRWNLAEISKRYCIKGLRAGMGFDRHVCHRGDVPGVKRPDVIFVGHWEPHTEAYITALRNAGLDVQVWGDNWRHARDAELRTVKRLPCSDYAATIARARIGLCSLSRWNRNESTGRTFELPAIGIMMLAEHTPEHEFIYGNNSGAVFFLNASELVEKARYYLDNPGEREAIALAGHKLSNDPGYSWVDHIRREWPIVERMLSRPDSMPAEGEDAPFWKGFRDGVPPPQLG